MRIVLKLCIIAFIGHLVFCPSAWASSISSPLEQSNALSRLDAIVESNMVSLGASAASIAISKNGELVHQKGFGWSDPHQSKPVEEGTMFRLASNTKPFTSAVIYHLVRARKISLNTCVFGFLGIKPLQGRLGDARIPRITVRHLLEHRGGWDRDQTFDPMYQLFRIRNAFPTGSALTVHQIIEFMWAQPLQFSPGTKVVYSNFGFLVLGRVIEKATGQSYAGAVQSLICDPFQIADVRLSETNPGLRDAREIFYPRESGLQYHLRDSVDGLAGSAVSLIRFMRHFWITGDVRVSGERRSLYHFGSHPESTTAIMEQRLDGMDYVVLFNARKNDHYQQDIHKIRFALNRVLSEW